MNGQQTYDDKFAGMTREKLRNQVKENKKISTDLRALAKAAKAVFELESPIRPNDVNTPPLGTAWMKDGPWDHLKQALARPGIVSLIRIGADGLPSAEELRERHDAGWLLTRRARIKAGLDKE